MKKSKAVVAALAAAMLTTTALGLAACKKNPVDDNPNPTPNPTGGTITVTFDANGGTFPASVTTPLTATADSNGNIALPGVASQPEKTDNTFLGWSLSSTSTSATDAITTYTTFTSSTTVYAIWQSTGSNPTPDPDPNPNPTPDPDPNPSGPVTTSGNDVLVNGTVKFNLTKNEGATGGGASNFIEEYWLGEGVTATLAAGDVVTFTIGGTTLTHTADTLGLWSGGGHGIKFDQTAGTFTVRDNSTGTFAIYVQHYDANPSEGTYECWTIVMDDGGVAVDDRETCDGTSVYLVGKMFEDSKFEWEKGLKLVDNTVTVQLEAGHEVKIREGNTGHGFTQIKSGKEYFNDVDGENHNLQVKEDGVYTFTWIPGEYKFDITKD